MEPSKISPSASTVSTIPPWKISQATPKSKTDPQSGDYASFWRRFCAAFLDGVIVSILSMLFTLPFNTASSISSQPDYLASLTLLPVLGSLLSLVVSFGYPVYFIGKKGATPGKMALGIKVINRETNEPPGYVGAFLRESVGKLLSGLVLGIGYLWMIKDDKKQTWHDKIAGTVVINSKS